MGKFLVRITVIIVGVYITVSLLLAHLLCIDIMDDWYVLLFEAICVIYCYSEGKYHCEHLKHLSLSILLSEIITRTDNHWDYMSVSTHNLIPTLIMTVGIGATCISAFKHFYRVKKLKNKLNG